MSNTLQLIDTIKKELLDTANREKTELLNNISSLQSKLDESTSMCKQLNDALAQTKESLSLVIAKNAEIIKSNDEDMLNIKNNYDKLIASKQQEIDEAKSLIPDDNDFVIAIDPRVDNKPLPNDSYKTYFYGARAYRSSVYPGYVWRNGHWYKITKTLSFTVMNVRSFAREQTTDIDYTCILTDSFNEIFIDGVRVFALPSSDPTSKPYSMYYIPALKASVPDIKQYDVDIVSY